ncbi:MAG TPA: hypothetical protein VFJ90_06705, partial [Candidatus Didemnitutus sp.]|nr:hypothetical protein [Candidatus Didemnitutus sp.]
MKRVSSSSRRWAPTLLVLLALAVAPLRGEREVRLLTDGWKFVRHDTARDASIADWESVVVPHTWNAQDGQTHDPKRSRDSYYR